MNRQNGVNPNIAIAARLDTDFSVKGASSLSIGGNFTDLRTVAGYSPALGDYYTVTKTLNVAGSIEFLIGHRWRTQGDSLAPVGFLQTLIRYPSVTYDDFEIVADHGMPRYLVAANTNVSGGENVELQLIGEVGDEDIRFSPPALDFQSNLTEMDVAFDIYSFTNVSISDNEPWIDWGILSLNSSVGAGSIQVTVDRTGLAQGVYHGEVDFCHQFRAHTAAGNYVCG